MHKVKHTRRDGLYLVVLGAVVLLFFGTIAVRLNPASMVDFRVVYYPARCLIQHCDPYNEAEVLRIFRAEEPGNSWDTANTRHSMRYIYLPTAFSFTLPFAVLPWKFAHVLWMMLTVGSLIFASFLIWDIGADFSPVLSGAFIGLFLANSEMVMMLGNAAAIVTSLSVVAAWCFFRDRFVPAGIVCLALSLAIKPHDTGLVWLYFLLAGGVHRKRALKTLLVVVALSLPAVLWVSHVAPHWMQELHNNIAAFSAPNSISDPSLASKGVRAIDMMISMQSAISFFWNDARIYNLGSYLICGPLLLVWAFQTLRSRPTPARIWLALAAIAALSMLPTYHREHDAKLLLLTVPACVLLWAEGGLLAWIAIAINAAGLIFTGDLLWMSLFGLFDRLHWSAETGAGRFLTVLHVFATPTILLAMGIFYLSIYLRRSSAIHESQPLLASR
jgi:hypothetical protein